MKKVKNRKTRKISNFTLMELVVVIMVLVVFASVATPLYFRHVSQAKISTAKTQIKLLEQALMDFRVDVGTYPDSLDGLMSNPGQYEKWNGPYIKPSIPKDPWGNDYVYMFPGEHLEFDLMSYGNDGQAGGEGENSDIVNWE